MLQISSSGRHSARRMVWQRMATSLLLTLFVLGLVGPSHTVYATSTATTVATVAPQRSIPNAPTSPTAVNWPNIYLESIADSFAHPVNIVSPNDGTDRLFVLESGGLIYVIENGTRLETAFLDISDRVTDCLECGLLGLAFPPDFAQQGYFFVNYTSNTDLIDPEPGDDDNSGSQRNGDTVIARFHVTDNPNVADSQAEEQILVINQPEANHNGGHILFGPDDNLYIGMGDGGGGGDQFQNAQDPDSLLGKILRISVGITGTYTIPTDNPFIDVQGYRDEIWAMGVRNPWRYTFDHVTGDLYIADVGQGASEEVNHIAAADLSNEGGNGGMNFGWPIMEGTACFPPGGAQDCSRTGLTLPVATYNHDLGDCSITGGFVYRSQFPAQLPVYLYADYCTGRIWGLQQDGDSEVSMLLKDTPMQITSFGEDAEGNVYVVSSEGTIYQVHDLQKSYQFLPTLSSNE